MQSKSRFAILPSLLLVFSFSLAGCGGGGKSGADSVSGKVTLGGQAVSGEIVFVGPDKKELASPIGKDGTYQISGASKGENQVLVRSMGGGLVAPPKGGDKTTTAGGLDGTPPPAKYAKPDNGLKFEVTGGKQEKNFELQP
jgi:predicted small secreted protein